MATKPTQLDHEDRLLSALGPQERDALADLLRKLMLSGGAACAHRAALGGGAGSHGDRR